MKAVCDVGAGKTACGFTLLETVVSMAIVLTIGAVAFSVLSPAANGFVTQSEAADMQQRLRAGIDALVRDIAGAGERGARGTGRRVARTIPSILPYRLGPRSADPSGTARSDIVSLIGVPATAAEAAIDQPLAAANGSVVLRLEPGCPLGDAACGFREGMDVLAQDESASSFDLFTVESVLGSTLTLRHLTADWPKVYAAGSVLTQVETQTYYARAAQPGRPPQLVRYSGAQRADVPVVDHVVGLAFEYYGDPEPPTMVKPLADPVGPWVTYGPMPPPEPGTVPPLPLANCVLVANGTALAAPLLPALGPADGPLVPLTPATLRDGPFCPDALAPTRFDADLLRIRSVGVTLRVEAAAAALRGPAGVLFARGGTATAGSRYVPDLEVRIRVAARGSSRR